MKKTTSLIGLTLLLSACASMDKAPLKTQLQVREFQTRSFETPKTNDVLSAVVEAFQDQGFMVKNVVPEVGLVSSSRDVDVEDINEAFMQRFFFGQNARWGKISSIEATANVKTQGQKTKVRVTFQEKVLNNMGTVDHVKTIEDQRFYQDFFDKVGKSIFIEGQKVY
ncbi:MAG: hypothetical protein ACD_16C00117G0027 [uncultured bacterium]|nr:MAG: hypothetical protein ACD_16C00117G0027 [uncultured bacterium]OFW68312.1 MAG: hypothetical protein A2X70_03860 [Alphaproteobacteria bacterium GWC2_42_16]OFW74786.1 MAG: hypothetical protein A2Z80_01725 [Alphaproteobacteria bacterium GWA2_41_27]OFW85169.1 MAG: hypothetical protein A3E50_06240 [Alphaproteobacteria bacterium RIFCSPHIGHO2_12_FULL_42_100]OFW85744.1 MAG: hypothetical protein A2W06_04245 [Alphaproteobacteria bacterium RBG_16_42_14]OFW91536.1 MAG: hypothetical protein A2W46_057